MSVIEPLEKKCPRCGSESANPSNPSGRCKACLAKLASNKKKPGHWQRAQTKADDALRRQKGKNGTAHKKSKGLGTRASIVKQTKAAERKTGQKLSPDRKNNSEGYASSNTRMVPEKLNRGRHHVDGKKLRAWQKRLKKTETNYDEFYTYLLAKAHETDDTALLTLLYDMHPNDVGRFLENEDLVEDSDSLEKAVPSTQSFPNSYSFVDKANPPGYTGKDAKKAQLAAVKHVMKTKVTPYKTMTNEETGKPELHVMVHRGLDKNPKTKDLKPNQLKISDTRVEQPYNSVHTLSRDVADNYAQNMGGETHSFWVPISNVMGVSKYIDGRFKNPNQPLTPETKEVGASMMPEYDPNASDEQVRDFLANEDPNHDEHHVVVRPGKFKRVVGEEAASLKKNATPKLSDMPETPKTSGPSLANEVGKTHTVEIHPDIDHLYRAKGLMVENNKDKLHINEFKKNGQFGHILNKLPKDAKGFVTPEAIDKHIAELPKTKVNIRVLEGKNRPGEQKHRSDAPEYTLSMDMHPEHKMKMDPKHRKIWDRMKKKQHSWEKEGSGGVVNEEHQIAAIKRLLALDQVGWVRVDPNKHTKTAIGKIADTSDGGEVHHTGDNNYIIKHPKGDVNAWYDRDADHISSSYHKPDNDDESGFETADLKDPKVLQHLDEAEQAIKNHKAGFEEHPHWHLDEIQSDFQNPKKVAKAAPDDILDDKKNHLEHPEYEGTRAAIDEELDGDKDTPFQKEHNDYMHDRETQWAGDYASDYRDSAHHNQWYNTKRDMQNGHLENLKDPHFKSAVEKLGPDALHHFAEQASIGGSAHAYEFGNDDYAQEIEDLMRGSGDPKVINAIPNFKSLTAEEKKAVGHFLENHHEEVENDAHDMARDRFDRAGAAEDFRDQEAERRLKEKDPDYFKEKPFDRISDKDREDILNHLSHGHEDPQHALHSAANALGRKFGVKSMSMDTPEDQAKKSVLRTAPPQVFKPHPPEQTWRGWHKKLEDYLKSSGYKHDPESWNRVGPPLVEQLAAENDDFKSVANKLGPKGLEAAANLVPKNDDGWMYEGEGSDWDKKVHPDDKSHPELDNETKAKLKDLSPQERDELSSFLNMYRGKLHEDVAKQIGLPERPAVDASEGEYVDVPEAKKQELPVHQINTYNKRPKKLGMKPVDKKQVLGEHPEDKTDHQIQYMNLHKKLAALRHYLEELKKNS